MNLSVSYSVLEHVTGRNIYYQFDSWSHEQYISKDYDGDVYSGDAQYCLQVLLGNQLLNHLGCNRTVNPQPCFPDPSLCIFNELLCQRSARI